MSMTRDIVLTDNEIAQIRAEFSQYGVDEDTQTSLIEKMQNGIVWDSQMPGATPVSERVEVNARSETTIRTYADGSIMVLSVEVPHEVNTHGVIRPLSVTGCIGSGTTYSYRATNCYARVAWANANIGFYFDWQADQGMPSKITNYYSPTHSAAGMSLSGNLRFTRISSSDVRLAGDFILYSGSGSLTLQMGA